MPICGISRFVLAFALVAAPAHAAVTVRGAVPDDNPRAGWLDRYSEARQGPETVDKASQTFKVGTDGTLDLSNISGDVKITAGPGTEIKIDATKRIRHRDPEEAKRLMDQLKVETSNVNGRLEVRTIYPRRTGNYLDRGISVRVDYVVTVPNGTSVTTKNISGNIVVTGVKGEVRIETISGDVDVSGTPNLALAKTVSGNVRARDIGGSTTLTLGTISGTLIATGLKVRALECGSVSGDIQLSGLQVERIEAKSVSGNIEFDAPLGRQDAHQAVEEGGLARAVGPDHGDHASLVGLQVQTVQHLGFAIAGAKVPDLKEGGWHVSVPFRGRRRAPPGWLVPRQAYRA